MSRKRSKNNRSPARTAQRSAFEDAAPPSPRLQRTIVVALSIGIALLVWGCGTGNVEIAALPFAFWTGVCLWPRPGLRASARTWFTAAAMLSVWGLFAAHILETTAQQGPDLTGIERRLDEADSLYEQGDRAAALALLESVEIPATLPIQNARRHHNCGLILVQLDRTDEAVPHLEEALQFDAADAQAAYLLGAIAWKNRQVERSHQMLDAALAIDPGYQEALALKVRILRDAARQN